VVPDNLHDFFVASGSVAGALIGLLFVAISVASGRLAAAEAAAQIHRIRASAALTAFLNALVVSLFSLIPVNKIGPTSVAVSIAGLVFVVAALLSLVRQHQLNRHTIRDGVFLGGLVIVFVVQLVQGAYVVAQPRDTSAVENIAVLVVVCFIIGIQRSWELIGGPSYGFAHEVTALVRSHIHADNHPADEESR
jgi:uncharacterized paraquat-inducible protein A